jgi:predicted nucleotidyltransferase
LTFDPRPYAEGIRRRNEEELEEIRSRASLAREEALRLARAIREADAGVTSVILFGSLAQGEPKRLGFDIDLALEGGDLYRALDIVQESPFRIDLVDLALLGEEMAARIRMDGKRLS